MIRAHCSFALVVDLEKGHQCHAHTHNYTELVFCIGCEGVLVQDEKEYPYGDGEVFIYQPERPHHILNSIPGKQICVGVAGCGAERLRPGVLPCPGKVTARFEEFAACLQEAGSGEKLDLLAGLIVVETLEAQQPGLSRKNNRALRAQRIIEDHLNDDLDIGSIARDVYVSPDYLRQLFRREFGESILHYIIRKRIELARTLLTTSDEPVYKIAEECGYADPYYFSRIFKKEAGMTPTQYRKRG